ncbi:hypothetical protein CRUP_037388, partial [Coryphaenoides rupestris]
TPPGPRADPLPGASLSFCCSLPDCRQKESFPVTCPHCHKHFCLPHRHQEEHRCEKLEVPRPKMATTKELVQKILESKPSAAPKGRHGAKSSATAAKVALMKLKLHAAGDNGLPQVERTYFQVRLPRGSAQPSQPMFFCSKWSVGKVVDHAASLAGLKNCNNILTAKKLRLCLPETGDALRMDASLLSLLSCPDAPLHNGGTVILEYLDPHQTGLDQDSSCLD